MLPLRICIFLFPSDSIDAPQFFLHISIFCVAFSTIELATSFVSLASLWSTPALIYFPIPKTPVAIPAPMNNNGIGII